MLLDMSGGKKSGEVELSSFQIQKMPLTETIID